MTQTASEEAPISKIRQLLAAGKNIWLDAGNGTELQARGAKMHPKVWCGIAHVEYPEIMHSIHCDNIKAGANVITSNTFSSNRNMMGPAGLGGQVKEAVTRGVELALQARQQTPHDHPVLVAGSMSHQVPITPGTNRRNPDTLPTAEVARENFNEIAQLLADAGADLLLLEMMSDPDLAHHAIDAASATGLPVWLGLCCKKSDTGELVSYTRPDMSFATLCNELIDSRSEAVGIMHSNIDYVRDAISCIRSCTQAPVMAYPDSGHFTMPEWNFEETISPHDYAQRSTEWINDGVQIIGACCGMGVEHIDACVTAARS